MGDYQVTIFKEAVAGTDKNFVTEFSTDKISSGHGVISSGGGTDNHLAVFQSIKLRKRVAIFIPEDAVDARTQSTDIAGTIRARAGKDNDNRIVITFYHPLSQMFLTGTQLSKLVSLPSNHKAFVVEFVVKGSASYADIKP